MACPKCALRVRRFRANKKRPLPNASKPVAKRAKTEVGLLEVDDPALAEHVDKHASSARTLRSDEYSFAIPNGSVHKQMQKAVLKGTVCGFDGELLNLGYYLNALHKECFKRAKADPSQRDPDYMQVCKELGLNALLQGVANAVAGQHAKERVYDKTSINTFFHNMMGAHNLQATRYRAPLGAIMKAQGQTQTTIRTTNKYNMTESPDTAMRYLNKALAGRAESVVRLIGEMRGTVNPTVTADTEYANCTIWSVWIHDQCLVDNVNVADLSGNVVYLCQFCEFVNDYGSAPSKEGWAPAQTISVPAAH